MSLIAVDSSFILRTIAAGSHIVNIVYHDFTFLDDILGLIGRGASHAGKLANKHLVPSAAQADFANAGKKIGNAMGHAYRFGENVAWYMAYNAASYPLNALVFLFWQKGVTVIVFLVIPTIIALWATFHAIGLRNYFASNPKEFDGVSMLNGPVYYDSDESYQDDEVSEYEAEPLRREQRRERSSSQITVVQSNSPRNHRNIRKV